MNARDAIRMLLLGALVLSPALAVAQTGDRPPAPAVDRFDATHVAGTIATIQGSSLQLDNGRVVFLHDKTVINPTGIKLQPGMHIAVLGSPSSRDAIDANEIDVGPSPSDVGASLDRYRSTYTSGTIATIQGSSLQLDNGRVVFLHRGTVIAPTGTKLQPGMRISVLGSPSSRDAIDANQIQVSGTGASGS